jgi:hypothetical protein
MTREERLVYCKVCKKRSFNTNLGIICSLTGEHASFNGTCSDFDEDPREVHHVQVQQENIKAETKKGINRGRYALFILGGFNLIYGIYELTNNEDPILYYAGIIDSIIGLVFIGLGVLSLYRASLSMLIGLIFYSAIILLMALVDPLTIVQGIIWKVIIISSLIYSFRVAREEESKNRVPGTDLLDQL